MSFRGQRRCLAAVCAVALLACSFSELCRFGWAADVTGSQPSASTPPYDVEVQDLIAPVLAPDLGPMAGSAYVNEALGISSTNGAMTGGSAAVCARADTAALIAPLPVTTLDALFRVFAANTTAHLDVLHGCYLDVPASPGASSTAAAAAAAAVPSCVAALSSTREDCGGNAADAVGPWLAAVSPASPSLPSVVAPPAATTSGLVAPSSAAALARYFVRGGAPRLRLERALRRTREAAAAFARVYGLVHNASSLASVSEAELQLLRARATAEAAAVAAATYTRVMDKYYVLNTWLNASLGIVPDQNISISAAVGPDVAACPVSTYFARLLWGTEGTQVVLRNMTAATLALADRVHRGELRPAVRGLMCVQVLTALAVMALEDDAVRTVAALAATGKLNNTTVWSLSDFDVLAPDYTAGLRQRQLWSLAYAFDGVADPAVAQDLVGGVSIAACMRRASLVDPAAGSGTVPPSTYWCLYNTSMPEMASDAVRRRSLAVREAPGAAVALAASVAAASPSLTGASPQCRWGLSTWDGACGAADGLLDSTRCETCPPGSVGDGEGHCVCGDADASYVTLTGGCVAKGSAHDTPGVRLLQRPSDSAAVTLSGDAPAAALFTAQLPTSAVVSDPSAFLRVDVTCSGGGGGGGTRLLATPAGTRAAACSSVVAYERQEERTGLWHTTPDGPSLRLVTYAENLTITATGTAAFDGETCRVSVTVGSSLRRASRPVAAGPWLFRPAAAPLQLAAAPACVGSTATAALPLPSCGEAVQGAGGAAILAGVCRVSATQLAVFVAPGQYRVFPSATLQVAGARARHSVTAAHDAYYTATAAALSSRTAVEVVLEASAVAADAGASEVWTATWTPNVTPLADNALAAGWYANVSTAVLHRMRMLRVRVVDHVNASAFITAEGAVPCECHDGVASGSGASASGSGVSGSGSGSPEPVTAEELYGPGYVVAIAILSVVVVALLVLLGAQVYLLTAVEEWPKKLLL